MISTGNFCVCVEDRRNGPDVVHAVADIQKAARFPGDASLLADLCRLICP